jgi:hypothetical protein
LNDHPASRVGAVDNKWVSSAVSNALILRHLTLAFSTECQNHANLSSLFGRHQDFIQNPSENFRFPTDSSAVGGTEVISPTKHLRYIFALALSYRHN